MTTPRKKIRPGRCTVCAHPDRVQIELLRCAGASYEALGAQFNLSADSIWRHFKTHVTERRKAELLAGPARINDLVNSAAKESKSLLDYLGVMRGVLFNQFLASAEANDRQGVVNVSSQLLAALRQLGTVTGELRALSGLTINNNVLNVNADPSYPALEEGLLEIVRRHPAVREDICALLAGLEATSTPPGPNGAPYPVMIEAEAVRAEEIEMAAHVS